MDKLDVPDYSWAIVKMRGLLANRSILPEFENNEWGETTKMIIGRPNQSVQ
jgi:hypothetical protein